MSAELTKRRLIAKDLLLLQKKIEPTLLKIDGLKDQLREIASTTGEGFNEEIRGKGTVQVKGPRQGGI